MTLIDVVRAVRRRWRAVTVVFLTALVAGTATLLIQTPVYQSTATIGLVPGPNSISSDNNVLGQLAVAAPLFSEAANSAAIRAAARHELPPNVALGALTVVTFRDTPLVFKLVATSGSPAAAQASASAYGRALQQAAQAGDILPSPLAQIRVLGAPELARDPRSPRPKVILAAAAFLGLALGVIAAVTLEGLAREGLVQEEGENASPVGDDEPHPDGPAGVSQGEEGEPVSGPSGSRYNGHD